MPYVVDAREKPFFEVDAELVEKYITRISSDAFKLLMLLCWLEDQPEDSRPEIDFAKLLNFKPTQVLPALAELRRTSCTGSRPAQKGKVDHAGKGKATGQGTRRLVLAE
jgi:hypothetical protein